MSPGRVRRVLSTRLGKHAPDQHGGNPNRTSRAVHPDLLRPYPKLVRGDGVHVIDDRGHRLLDAAAGVGVLSLGYTVPEIIRSMSDQAARLPYAHAMRFDSDPAQQLAMELSLVTADPIRDFFFCSGGSEAVESAMKITRQYHVERGEPSRFRFIGRWQSFHGNTIATQSVGGHLLRRKRQSALLIDFPHIETPNCYRCEAPKNHGECAQRYSEMLRMGIERAGPETIAGFIMESVGGATTGALTPPADYLERVRRICDDYGVLLILDEVYTSLGRTGRNFAFDHWSVVPDLVVMGKGLGAGFVPIGAVGIHEKVIATFEAGSGQIEHNFTFASHHVTCAAAATAVRIMREREVARLADRAGQQLRECLEPLRSRPSVGDVRGMGLMVGVEFVRDRATKEPFMPEKRFSNRVAAECYERGLIIYPGTGTVDGLLGDHILLTPPHIISNGDVATIGEILHQAVQSVEADVGMER